VHLPAYEDGTERSETSAYKFQTPGNHPKGSIQQRILMFLIFVTEDKTRFTTGNLAN
jgi:hypothetical protein